MMALVHFKWQQGPYDMLGLRKCFPKSQSYILRCDPPYYQHTFSKQYVHTHKHSLQSDQSAFAYLCQ